MVTRTQSTWRRVTSTAMRPDNHNTNCEHQHGMGVSRVRTCGGRTFPRVLATAAGTPRTFAEVEVALDTPHATAEERLADLERHAPWADSGRLRHVGSAAGLTALLERLRGVVDGVRLPPLAVDEDLNVLSGWSCPTSSSAATPFARCPACPCGPIWDWNDPPTVTPPRRLRLGRRPDDPHRPP
ncbi:hypothetical protein [Streptomyces sp. NPDC127119]|uniref:hypothetical protein n=1 Tax=Streptomyces sp. NPDC127119 TaxID=3345370 RepID=UPI00363F0A8E